MELRIRMATIIRKSKVTGLSFFIFSLSFLIFHFSPALAQPGWVKKATKSVVTVKTFDDNGTLLGSANGVFVSEGGDVVSSYGLFRGASRAVVIDASGKEWPVACVLGANETYDVCKVRIADAKKVQPLTVTAQAQPVGTSLWLLPYRETKSLPSPVVRKTETFNSDYTYYTLKASSSGQMVEGTPVLNANGEVVALLQPSQGPADTLLYAVSACFADSLRTMGLSINDPALKAINIRKALPSDESQAQLTLYVAGSTLDSAAYAQLVDDYVAQFPQSHEGYVYRAQQAFGGGNFADCDHALNEALQRAEALGKADEVHYTWSRLMLAALTAAKPVDYEAWNFQRAQQEAEAAYAANPLPIYRQQQAYVLAAEKHYDDASAIYAELFQSPLRSPELFYEASRCRVLAGDTVGQLALLDSCVACFSRPLLKEAAPFILARAEARMDAGEHRQAVNDLNDYGELMKAQLSDGFYYLRYQAELGGRLFQQALNDIAQAVQLNPQSELYLSEQASLQVRVGLYEDAIGTAQQLVALAPDHSDGYLFLGLAQCLTGKKTEGATNLQRAKELGDPQADELIEKYSK